MKLTRKQRNTLSTILGGLVAIATAWLGVDWETFAFDFNHIAPLILSALVAIWGRMTTINSKQDAEDS